MINSWLSVGYTIDSINRDARHHRSLLPGHGGCAQLHEILILLRNATGDDFKLFKRANVLRRLEHRLQVTAQSDLGAHYDYLRAHPL